MTILDFAMICQAQVANGLKPELGLNLANVQPQKAAVFFLRDTATNETKSLFAKAWRQLLKVAS